MAKRHISLECFSNWVLDVRSKYPRAEIMNVSTALIEDEWKYVIFIRDSDKNEFRYDIPMFTVQKK